jgi:hypothetical protein
MCVQSTDSSRERDALGERDPETLVGPLLWLLTRLARDCASADARCECTKALVDLLTALAAHPGVAIDLRLASGALAIEHRDRALAR